MVKKHQHWRNTFSTLISPSLPPLEVSPNKHVVPRVIKQHPAAAPKSESSSFCPQSWLPEPVKSPAPLCTALLCKADQALCASYFLFLLLQPLSFLFLFTLAPTCPWGFLGVAVHINRHHALQIAAWIYPLLFTLHSRYNSVV